MRQRIVLTGRVGIALIPTYILYVTIGLCDGPITRPEESYRVRCVCDYEDSVMKRPWPTRAVALLGGEGELN